MPSAFPLETRPALCSFMKACIISSACGSGVFRVKARSSSVSAAAASPLPAEDAPEDGSCSRHGSASRQQRVHGNVPLHTICTVWYVYAVIYNCIPRGDASLTTHP